MIEIPNTISKMVVIPKEISRNIREGMYVNVITFEEENSFLVQSEFSSEDISYVKLILDLSKKHTITQMKVIESMCHELILQNGLKYPTIHLFNKNSIIVSIDKTQDIFLKEKELEFLIEKTLFNEINSLKDKLLSLPLLFKQLKEKNQYFWDCHDDHYLKSVNKKPLKTEFIFCPKGYNINYVSIYDLYKYKLGFIKKVKITHVEKIGCVTVRNHNNNDTCFWP